MPECITRSSLPMPVISVLILLFIGWFPPNAGATSPGEPAMPGAEKAGRESARGISAHAGADAGVEDADEDPGFAPENDEQNDLDAALELI